MPLSTCRLIGVCDDVHIGAYDDVIGVYDDVVGSVMTSLGP
jgi:hypothetical protein